MRSIEANIDGERDATDQLRPHEFFVIRYVPDIVRGEFLNIGIVVREALTGTDVNPRQSAVRITRDWDRVQRFFLDADLDLIQDTEDEFESWLHEVTSYFSDPRSEFDRKLEQLSNVIQLTDPQPCLAADIDTQLNLLMRMYVDASDTPPPMAGNRALQDTVREWSRRNLDETSYAHKRSEKYTTRGDPLVLDCLWKSQRATHVIHALAISENVDQALALTQRMDSLRRGIVAVEGKPLDMTVVVESPPDSTAGSFEAAERYDFALGVLRQAGIRVITVADLPQLAQDIKRSIRP